MRWLCELLRRGLPYRAVLALEGQIISDHRDKLRIRRFSLDAGDRVAEILLQHLHVAAVPRDLDGVRASTLLWRGWLGSFAGCFSL